MVKCAAFKIGGWLYLVLLIWPAFANAHVLDYGAIETSLHISGSSIYLETVVPQYIEPSLYNKDIAASDLVSQFAYEFNYFQKINQTDSACAFKLAEVERSEVQSRFSGSYSCPRPISDLKELKIHSSLFLDDFKNLDHFVTISHGSKKWEIIFSRESQDFPTDVKANYLGNALTYFSTTAGKFLWLGGVHIWTGWDHILFLLAAILLARPFKKAILVISAFTIAHSITLFLSAFQFVRIASNLVELAIAVTIIYVAVRNLLILRRDKLLTLTETWSLTFAFGLIHGLGFASVLGETRIPSDFFIPAVLFFNVGVELGQIAILLIVIPALWSIDKLSIQARRLIFQSLSATILTAGLGWFIVRLVG